MTNPLPYSALVSNEARLSLKTSPKSKIGDRYLLFVAIWHFCRLNRLPIELTDKPNSMSQVIRDCFSIDNFLGTEFFRLLTESFAQTDYENTALPNPQPLALPEIALIYERCLDAAMGKREGVFLTPLSIVQRMIAEVFESITSSPLSQTLTFLDPAVGSGIFLIECFKTLARSKSDTPEQILKNSLFGIDKEPMAVEATKLFLNLTLLELMPPTDRHSFKPADLSKNIILGNALLDDADFTFVEGDSRVALGARNWDEVFKSVFARGGFDAVIGNPPYGLSRGQQLSSVENKKLQDVYESMRSGKVNKYLLFMARALKLVKRGGNVTFIVPNAWLGIEGGRAMRAKLIDESALAKITSFRCKVFDQPSVEPVIVTILPGRKCERIALQTLSCLDLNHAGNISFVPRAVCLASPDRAIPITWSDSTQEIFIAVDNTSHRLDQLTEIFKPRIAIQAYAAGKGAPPQTNDDVANHVFDLQVYQDELSIRYLDGSDIEKYKFTWRNKYLKYGPWLAEPQKIERFARPRVAVREILAPAPYRIIACPITETFLYNKSVLHILTSKTLDPVTAEKYAWALSAILNSKLGSFWISNKGKKSQRRIFPKLVLADLNGFPICKSFDLIAAKLSELAKKLSSAKELAAIDSYVYKVYELSAQHVDFIEKNLDEWRTTLSIQ
jgi:hypothetical protein